MGNPDLHVFGKMENLATSGSHSFTRIASQRISPFGPIGFEASWECWYAGSIPGWGQRIKDLALLQLWLRSQLWLGTDPYAMGQPKKKKKKKTSRGCCPAPTP